MADNDEIGLRLDYVISEKYGISRNLIKNGILSENILVNQKTSKPSYKLKSGDEISLDFNFDNSEKIEIKPQNISLNIIYEDEYIAVINKPQGMVVHPGSGNYENTLVNALLFKYGRDNLSGINGILRPGIVHRLDKDTSGLIIVAKMNSAHQALAEEFKRHKIYKEYTFICHGVFENDFFIVDEPIGRNKKNRLKMDITADGKPSITEFSSIETFDKKTYGKAVIKTGRTHQIRLHLSYVNHPIVGDTLYSNRKEFFSGQLLHAKRLRFVHPITNENMEFEANEPEFFLNYLEKLEKGTII